MASYQEFFSIEECKAFIKFIEGLPLELTPPKKRGEAERVNRGFLSLHSDSSDEWDRRTAHRRQSLHNFT